MVLPQPGVFVKPDSVLARTAREMLDAHAGGSGPRDGMTICPQCGERLPCGAGQSAAEVVTAAGLAQASGLVAAARQGRGPDLGRQAFGRLDPPMLDSDSFAPSSRRTSAVPVAGLDVPDHSLPGPGLGDSGLGGPGLGGSGGLGGPGLGGPGLGGPDLGGPDLGGSGLGGPGLGGSGLGGPGRAGGMDLDGDSGPSGGSGLGDGFGRGDDSGLGGHVPGPGPGVRPLDDGESDQRGPKRTEMDGLPVTPPAAASGRESGLRESGLRESGADAAPSGLSWPAPQRADVSPATPLPSLEPPVPPVLGRAGRAPLEPPALGRADRPEASTAGRHNGARSDEQPARPPLEPPQLAPKSGRAPLQPPQFVPQNRPMGQAQPGQAQPGQAQPGQAQPGQAQPGQTPPGQPQPGQTGAAGINGRPAVPQGDGPPSGLPPLPGADET